jgi:hypothetical protein
MEIALASRDYPESRTIRKLSLSGQQGFARIELGSRNTIIGNFTDWLPRPQVCEKLGFRYALILRDC